MTASPHAWANIRLSLYGLMRQRCNSLTVFVSITVIAADGVSDFGCTLANRSLSKTLVWADLFTPGRFWSGKLSVLYSVFVGDLLMLGCPMGQARCLMDMITFMKLYVFSRLYRPLCKCFPDNRF
ncbi:hypothetical protein BO85DRAFT_92011 [Aspergillus piperis CBS 112811]|uniref:Uncharacterized protein n=1 Tax=Aspergillus piperis CBS 112811 TaxID=1448313 RepID=A0A8G1VJ01_9EURO|nr:hypothetical protein BO85DRAFT_92011 [Aspergillus piperis CBS 112811]RAH55084.1 hypothetical protein BO85DRAFT_92011 [Aspergillus piperis CBS 112811]